MKKLFVPRWIRAYALFILANWAVFTAFRGIFLFVFRAGLTPEHYHELWETFYIGAKFDMRLACALAIALGFYLTACAFYQKLTILKKGVAWIYGFLEAAVLLIYFADFGHYAYISMRINSSIFHYSENASISVKMAWETYPVIWAFLGLLVFGVIGYFFVKKLVVYAFGNQDKYRWKGKLGWFFIGLILTGALMFGQISQYPLRWSNAYHSTNSFISNLTLNPILNLYDTYRFVQEESFDRQETKKYYDVISKYLGVTHPDKETLNFGRVVPAKAEQHDYNVVIIFMESLAWNKTSMTNPDIDPTPFVAELAKKSILFTNFFTPTSATARAVFATLTGIPDVSTFKTSSRNPLVVNQHMIFNVLSDYNKYFMIGGSSSWGNIRGIIEHNIIDVNLYEEGRFEHESRNDVWGISDLDLFREANRILEKDHKTSGKPFFAIIQTAGYHRPYTIPADNAGFEVKKIDEELAKQRSFVSVDEYNSLRFSDHALKEFFKLAENSDYYKDTVFVIFGDHGLSAPLSDNMPRGYVDWNLINHQVPLILAGPVIKEPKVVSYTASQVDIIPTVMGLLGKGYYTRAIGRDMLATPHPQEGALIYAWAAHPTVVGFVQGQYYYQKQADNEGLYKYAAENYKEDLSEKEPEVYQRMKNLALGLYETSRYLFYNNPKSQQDGGTK